VLRVLPEETSLTVPADKSMRNPILEIKTLFFFDVEVDG